MEYLKRKYVYDMLALKTKEQLGVLVGDFKGQVEVFDSIMKIIMLIEKCISHKDVVQLTYAVAALEAVFSLYWDAYLFDSVFEEIYDDFNDDKEVSFE